MSFDDFDHATLEGFTMHQDGYVLDVKCVDYGNSYVALKISKLSHVHVIKKLNSPGYYWRMGKDLFLALCQHIVHVKEGKLDWSCAFWTHTVTCFIHEHPFNWWIFIIVYKLNRNWLVKYWTFSLAHIRIQPHSNIAERITMCHYLSWIFRKIIMCQTLVEYAT